VLRQPPRAAGIPSASWTGKAVVQFVRVQFDLVLSATSARRYLHRLGFGRKRPKKLLVKADADQRAAFVRTYAEIVDDVAQTGASILFVDEAHFRADAELGWLWTPRGEPALVPSTSPRRAEKAAYYSAVCLETGTVEVMPLDGTSSAATSVAFLQHLRAAHPEPLVVIWDNGPAHRGEALRAYLSTPDLELRLVALPAYSPDYNADEAVWKWARAEVTANTCWGTAARVRAALDPFFAGLAERADEVRRRCRSQLQADLAAWMQTEHGHLTCASV
jgi:transposase